MNTIELDCAPGTPRPSDLLPGVLDGTGITIDPENTIGRLFGNWEWEIPEEFTKQYEDSKAILKERITALHQSGRIRYGSW
jgi:hypothetical protein